MPFSAAIEHVYLFRHAYSTFSFEEPAWHALLVGEEQLPVGVPYEANVIPVIISLPVQDNVKI